MIQVPIPSAQKFALISEEDADLVLSKSWFLRDGYPSTNIHKNGKRTCVFMHRLIMFGLSENDLLVDHVDRDRLNNTRENLRVCTNSQNQANRTTPKNNSSGYKGVRWLSKTQKWQAMIKVNNRVHCLGCYRNPKNAARAYNKAALHFFGEFAYLNEV
jgi:hypothetical protein